MFFFVKELCCHKINMNTKEKYIIRSILKASANKNAILLSFQTPIHFTYFGWTFVVKFFSWSLLPPRSPQWNLTVKAHLKYVECWGIWNANPRIAFFFASALIAFQYSQVPAPIGNCNDTHGLPECMEECIASYIVDECSCRPEWTQLHRKWCSSVGVRVWWVL